MRKSEKPRLLSKKAADEMNCLPRKYERPLPSSHSLHLTMLPPLLLVVAMTTLCLASSKVHSELIPGCPEEEPACCFSYRGETALAEAVGGLIKVLHLHR